MERLLSGAKTYAPIATQFFPLMATTDPPLYSMILMLGEFLLERSVCVMQGEGKRARSGERRHLPCRGWPERAAQGPRGYTPSLSMALTAVPLPLAAMAFRS